MFKLLDVLFIIKLYARVNISRKINEQEDIVKVVTGKKRVEYTLSKLHEKEISA